MTPLRRRKNTHPNSSVSLLKPGSICLLHKVKDKLSVCRLRLTHSEVMLKSQHVSVPPEDYLWQLLTEMPALTRREGGISGCETDCTGSVC